jgi:hypothetical protein
MGTLYGQKFFALKAAGPDLKFPFGPQPFTALVTICSDRDDAVLGEYAKTLVSHGCVQAICRGDGAERMDGAFASLAECGGLDRNGVAFTSMCLGDESFGEALHYFVLPSGLAAIGLVLVIGDANDFADVVSGFNRTAGDILELREEPVYAGEETACHEFA